jgi:hypothetical protein
MNVNRQDAKDAKFETVETEAAGAGKFPESLANLVLWRFRLRHSPARFSNKV